MKVDVYRDGQPWKMKQDPAKPAIWGPIKGAVINGRTVTIHPSAGTPPPPPPPHTASVFAGIGVFTAWDNHAAIGLPKADWVVVQLDPEGGGGESVGSLKEIGNYARVFGWQARPDNAGVQRAVTLGLGGYIGQAESEAEYEACLALQIGMPHALVGNVGNWWDSARVRAHGWELILEAYDNANPGLHTRLDSKGYPVASYLYGCYDAASEQADGSRVSLAQYRAWYPTSSWSVYLAETLTAGDRTLLGAV